MADVFVVERKSETAVCIRRDGARHARAVADEGGLFDAAADFPCQRRVQGADARLCAAERGGDDIQDRELGRSDRVSGQLCKACIGRVGRERAGDLIVDLRRLCSHRRTDPTPGLVGNVFRNRMTAAAVAAGSSIMQ